MDFDDGQVANVLRAADVTVRSRSKDDLIVYCPFHHNVRTPSGEVSTETGMFFCFSCKHTCDLPSFVAKAAGLGYFEAARLIAKHSEPGSIVDQVERIINKKEYEPCDPNMIEDLHNNLLRSQRAINYVKGRGLSRGTVEKYKLGYSKKRDMLTLPFMEPLGKDYLGFEARSIEGKRFMCNGKKSDTLFNLHNRTWSDYIFKVESSIDAMLMEQDGIPTIASMGTNHSNKQVDLLCRYFNTIYVVQDNDPADNDFAGQTSAKALLQKLGPRGILAVPPKEFKDVGEMTPVERKQFAEKTINILEGI